MVEKLFQFLEYVYCYDATKLKRLVKFYVPTWTLFAGLVTNSIFLNSRDALLLQFFTMLVRCEKAYSEDS